MANQLTVAFLRTGAKESKRFFSTQTFPVVWITSSMAAFHSLVWGRREKKDLKSDINYFNIVHRHMLNCSSTYWAEVWLKLDLICTNS